MEHIVKLSKVVRRRDPDGAMQEYRRPAGFVICENRACAMAIMTDMAHNSYAVEGGIRFHNSSRGSTFVPYDVLDMLINDYTTPKKEAD